MHARPSHVRRWTAVFLLLPLVLLGGCRKESKTAAPETPAAGGGVENAASTGEVDLSPETLEALVAPIALYPDAVLGQVLNASTNPQEVLDAGNWLLEHQDLAPRALNDEAAKLGLTQSTRALLQFPDVMDMMCSKIDWTTALGAAFTADQAAVLDAVQRMRQQASDVGNLQSSQMMTVKTETEEGKSAITIAPAKPEVIYVPKYDPVAVYAPPPATIPPPTGAAATSGVVATTANAPTTTSTTTASSGSNAVVTGLLCFTAGVVIASAFSHDDDWYNCYPHYGYGGMYYHGRPYYPPPPYMYRPPYGGGYYPAHGYHPPANYNHNFNNNTIVINNGGNNYWNNNNFKGGGNARAGTNNLKSPLTQAKPNRPELNQLNEQGRQRTQQAAARPSAKTGAANTRPTASPKPAAPKGSYAGTEKARAKNVADARPATTDRAATTRPGTGSAAKPSTANKGGADRATAARPGTAPSTGAVDRGYAGKKPDSGGARPSTGASAAASAASRPSASTPAPSRPAPSASSAARPEASRPTTSSSSGSSGGGGSSAFGSASRSGSSEQAASQRGHASMSQGASRTSSGSGGGGARRSR
jgi:hypothetical protein